ncbi:MULTISPECIES: VOC family protein [Mammaliicoccus]|uniref:VOC family protein n=1 Tax=Mammaliicoccus sciuri TaxID=1296 RepID=A0AAW5LRZ9_MAMSC|nr:MULTISPECIES: VOC family protein [Mammaliicoccus]MCD5141863.1 VOC family protein [Mammaliicoccus sciuri]MCQ9304463.1 VOC family protein [Mammaliicoccus sciuri]
MNLKFDHIIHYVDGIESIEFPHQYIQAIQGGKHTQLGTYNQLSYIDLHYIEWIDVFDAALARSYAQTEEGRLSFANTFKDEHVQEGFKRICLRTQNIDSVKTHLEQFDLDIIGPIEMSRTKPDGTTIQWQLLYLDDKQELNLPFIIQWGESDEEREASLEDNFHYNLSIDEVTIQVGNLQESSQNWQSWYGLKVIETNEEFVKLGFKEDDVVIKLTEDAEEKYTTLILSSTNIKKDTRILYKGACYEFKTNSHKH